MNAFSSRFDATGRTSTGMAAAPYMPTTVDVFAKTRDHDRAEILRAARKADVVPYWRPLSGPAGPVVDMEGAERVMLGSNNYLGLTGDERVKQGARDALDRYGTGLTGSRFMNGTIDLHLELEQELAEWMDAEAVIVFTTGHQANLGCLGTILAPGDTVIADSGDHASILDGCILSRAKLRAFRHNRLDKLERTLERAVGDGGGILVVVDGVFSMEGDVAPLPQIVELCRRFGARLMVDEAHAVGVLGARGAGTAELLEVEEDIDLRMGTFSKALAAARICRSSEGPQLFAGVLENAQYLHRGLQELGFHVVEPTTLPDGETVVTPIVPVLVGDDWKAALLWRALYDAGVYVNVAIHPAVPPGGALLRTSVMATHETEVLDRALDAFGRIKRAFEAEHGPLPGPAAARP